MTFIILTFLLVYIYAGYPIFLFLLAKLFPRRHYRDDTLEPTVTLVISAYNEEKDIEEKLHNALGLDYSAEKLVIMVVSDGSTDRTDEIVQTFHDRGVLLVRSAERHGKTAGLNIALTRVTSEIVVFSDANAMYDRFAIRRLVRHFADEKIGYAVGHARYEHTAETAAGSSEGAYWNIEVKIKEWESAFSSVVGGDGALYAIRSHLYEPLEETDINDFVNPLQIVAKGYRGIFDPSAWCTERPAGKFEKEFSRKIRIANRSFNGLLRVPAVCNPLKVGRFAWQLISHKLLRWFSPLVLCLHFVAALITADLLSLSGLFSLCFVLLYCLLAVFSFIGWRQDKKSKISFLFYIPYYFMLMNIASSLGIIMRLNGKVISIWETVREQSSRKDIASSLLPLLSVSILAIVMFRAAMLMDFYLQLLHLLSFCMISLLLYAYLGYPLVLLLLAKVRPVRIDKNDDFLPTVTLLITAYNEEHEMEAKLLNSLKLDYPRELLRIVVASDGSTDATNEIVRTYEEQVELYAFPVNRGKISAINDVMKNIASEIVVFSDANAMYDTKAVRKLVRNFHDSRVGAVSGMVILLNDSLSYKDAENYYYNIEHFVQSKEGETGCMIGADGAMYAIRRTLFTPPPDDTILDDFVIAMNIALGGHLVIHESEAVGYEINLLEIRGEFRRKVRIVAGGFRCLLRGYAVPGFRQTLLLFKFISHKVLRWFSGLMIIVLFIIFLQSLVIGPASDLFRSIALFSLTGAALIAVSAYFMPAIRKLPPVSFLSYFLMVTGASIAGVICELTGRQKVTWRGGDL